MKNPWYAENRIQSRRKNPFMQEAVGSRVTTLNKVYVLNGTETPVSFYTVIGDEGQTSSTDVMLVDASEKKRDLYSDRSGNIPVTALGTNASLKGARLFISCSISATSKHSNYCEGLVVVSGGDTPATHLLYETVSTHGEQTMLTCIVIFR